MSSSNTHPTVGIVRTVADWPMLKRVMTAIPAFLLAIAFTFSAAPMAMAAPPVANDGIVSVWQPDSCRPGYQPGVCPNGYPVDRRDNQQTMLPDQPITTHQSPSPHQ